MKRIPYLLLLIVVLAPPGGDAYAETMAERKQRIMRKYLRERQTVVQSDMVLPEVEEDERVSRSEKFGKSEEDLRPQKSVAPPQVMPVRPVPVQAQQNWLLDEQNTNADPYADPFAVDKGSDSEANKADWLAEWKSRQEEMAAEKQSDTAESSWYGRDSSYDSGSQSDFGQSGYTTYGYGREQDEGSRSFYGSSRQTTYGSQTTYGTQPNSGLGSFGTTRYGSSPSSGMLQWSTPMQDTDDGSAESATGYTPYKSPYQLQQEQRQQQGYPQPQQQEDFTKPTPYQKWKDNNQSWDPTADDAYLDELMRRNRR